MVDAIRQKTQSLLEKLRNKYGIQTKQLHVIVEMGKKEGEAAGLQDHWYLVDTHGQKFRLPKTMLFLGREECDVVVASPSVDKRHAVLTFDLYLNRFKLKDLSTTNGTFVNNARIPEQEYVTLQHMDSIRVGYDAMMYHIEQGSQITSQGGNLPDPRFIPSWASLRSSQEPPTIHVHAHAMAECQLHYIGLYGWFPTLGCIAEQHLEHSCGLHSERCEEDARSNETECRNHQHHHHHHHHHQQQQPHQQPLPATPTNCSNDSDQIHLHHQHLQEIEGCGDSGDAHNQELGEPDKEEVCAAGDANPAVRNTWPRKRVRQVPHVGSIFSQHESTDVEDANTSELRPAGPMSAMYFVSFDDSVCNGSTADLNGENTQRIPRNSKNPLPAELATVKKGTPLYGQPSWWGESEEDDLTNDKAASSSKHNVKRGTNQKDSRPSSLVLSNKESSNMEKEEQPQQRPDLIERRVSSGSTYMEIPVHDEDVTPENTDSPATVAGIPTSISEDSLLSPDGKPEQASKNCEEANMNVEKNPAMSFTIDLDDRPKKVNIGGSLSNFVPSKMRRNMQERKAAAATRPGSKESTPSKDSEERELSPTHQRKIDELWSNLENKGKTSHLSSVQATVGSSLRSPNLEDIDRLSELSEERRSIERDIDKKGKKPTSNKSPNVSKTTRGKTTNSNIKSTGSVKVSQYSDPASYLFDKMFEGDSTISTPSSSGEKEVSPEQKLYKEAASHDRMSRQKEKGYTHSQSQKSTSASKIGGFKADAANGRHRADSGDDLKIVEGNGTSVDDVEDKASEAGTYTIEAEEEEQDEVEAARNRIDEVFGILDDECYASGKPVLDLRLTSPGGYDNVTDDMGDGDRTPQEEESLTPMDDLVVHDGDEEEDQDEEETDKMASAWISQLTALTSQKASSVTSDSPRNALEDGNMSLNKKPPHGLSRKRPGTGRKLPSIPTDRSPVSSEHSSYIGDQDISNLEDVTPARCHDLPSNGKLGVAALPQEVTIKPTTFNGHSASPASRNIHVKGDASAEISPKSSARSRGSVDTTLLLQDTQTVMAAMEARMAYKSKNDYNHSQSLDDSDTDASSTVALVNGDEDYVKPTLFKSPRDAMSKRQRDKVTKTTASPAMATQSSSNKRAPPARSLSQTVTPKRSGLASPRSLYSTGGAKKSVVSDVYSRANSSYETDSIISDVGSDAGDRTDSKGKGTITMTKPNRAFQLRRARADSTDEPSTPRSGKSTTSTRNGVPGASVRSSSTHSTSRVRQRSGLDSGRSEASLGAQIVRKTKMNDRTEKAKSASNLDRADGGRFSLRLQRASSLTIAPQASLTYPGKKETTPKSHLRSTPSSNSRGNLSITGVNGVSRSQSQLGTHSQPGSRSNSPKAAERMAWKRRKEYDPRRAVAEAKAKTKDSPSSSSAATRQKPSSKDNLKRKMIRSASFGNSSQLSVCNSLSSTHSLGLSTQRDQQDGESFRRAFIPFQNSLRTQRSAHSADEEDSLASATSTQSAGRTYDLENNSQPMSAFTPPLISKTSPSPNSLPPPAALSLRRRSLQGVAGSLSFSLAPPLPDNDIDGLEENTSVVTPQISYDSLIVSSIYQLSLKLKTSTDKTLNKLREQDRVSFTPSPIDDYLEDSGKSEITAWKSANQELAGILRNLRKIERHVQIISGVVFPQDEMDSDGSTGREKQKYFLEIERIRSELAGFHPIENPRREDEVTSPDMEEFDETF